MDLYTCVSEALAVAGGQGMAANPVIQHEHLHAIGRFAQQQLLQCFAEGVVVDDEELYQHHFSRLFDSSKDGVEGGLAIDQQLHLVIGQAWHSPKFRHGTQGGVAL
ncbi:hypothetical protein D3C72_1922790 [compost metagenome]